MEAPELRPMIEIDSHGTVHTDALTLEKLKNQRFRLKMDGEIITLEPAQRRLSEIENIEERIAAYESFKQQLIRPGGARLPEDWASIRDSIYD